MNDIRSHFITQLVIFILEYFPLIAALIFIFMSSVFMDRNRY